MRRRLGEALTLAAILSVMACATNQVKEAHVQLKPQTSVTEVWVARVSPLERQSADEKQVTTAQTETVVIHFDLNSARIRPIEAERIKRAAVRLRKEAVGVDVKGYTCWMGPKDFNNWLAVARAKAVADMLSEQGVRVRSVSGLGKCCYVDSRRAEVNRRAEIVPLSGVLGDR